MENKKIAIVLSLIFIIAVAFLMFVEFANVFNISTNIIAKNSCRKIYSEPSGRNIVIRIDDIQAYYNSEIQLKMLDDLIKRNLTSTLAVIPFNLLEEKKTANYLVKHRCDFEIALHGYGNTDSEFKNLDYYEAKEKLKKGLKTLNKIEPNVMSFIPPNNEISTEARQAVFNSGIKIISSGFKNKEFGFSASTYDWEEDVFVDYQRVLDDCEKELDKNETCIIMIHPQDYTTNNEFDSKKYEEYIKLLDHIHGLNATIVTFRDLYYDEEGIIILD